MQDRKCSCPLCREVLLEPAACNDACNNGARHARHTSDASSQLERSATGSSDADACGELAGPLDETSAAELAVQPETVAEVSGGNGIWWLRDGRRRQRLPMKDTVAYVTAGVPGQQGVWARMGSSVIWLPSIKRTSEGAAQDAGHTVRAAAPAPIWTTSMNPSNSSMPSVWYPTL